MLVQEERIEELVDGCHSCIADGIFVVVFGVEKHSDYCKLTEWPFLRLHRLVLAIILVGSLVR